MILDFWFWKLGGCDRKENEGSIFEGENYFYFKYVEIGVYEKGLRGEIWYFVVYVILNLEVDLGCKYNFIIYENIDKLRIGRV